MSFHESGAWQDDHAVDRERERRWERADERERAAEREQDRLTADVGERKRRPRPDYNPRVDHPERYMRDGVWSIDV